MRALGKFFLLLLSTALLLGVGEFFLRSGANPLAASGRDAGDRRRFDPYVASGRLAYRLRPDWKTVHVDARGDFDVRVRTNELALRGPPAARSKADGAFRVLQSLVYAATFNLDRYDAARPVTVSSITVLMALTRLTLEEIAAADGAERIAVTVAAVEAAI